jgi:hypothetical protein
MNQRLLWSAFCSLVLAQCARSVEPELAPPPRLCESHVRFERTLGGYQVILTRKASEKLSHALKVVGDGTPGTEFAKLAVKELNDPEAEKKVEFLAFIVKSQAPALKKSLDEQMGPQGAIIKVFGVDNKLVPEPPPIARAFIPLKIREKMDTGLKVLNTTPLYWKIEGRK